MHAPHFRLPSRSFVLAGRGSVRTACIVIGSLLLPVTMTPDATAQSSTRLREQSANEMTPLDEVIDLYEQALTQVQALRAELAELKLQFNSVKRERDELKQFIKDYDEYGSAFEQYTIFVAQRDAEEKARRAEIARQKREERKRRLQELRRQRSDDAGEATPDDTDALLEERAQTLRRAGFTRVGESVFVGQMGYVYKTDNDREYRYSPWLKDWYISEEEVVDYSELTLSGTVIHAGDGLSDLSIAIAFYDVNGGQIGQTTVRVDGARPGVPYPFTSMVDMAASIPFDRYNAWVLYAVPIDPGMMPAGDAAPGTTPANTPADTAPAPSDPNAPDSSATNPADDYDK